LLVTFDSQPSTLNHRKTLLFPLCALACYWVVLIYYLGAQWSVYAQYNYGWSVPFLCAYLVYARIRAGDGRGEIERIKAGGGSQIPSSIVYLLLAICALLYAPTRFLHEANPTWRLTSLLWTLEVIGLTLLVLRLFAVVGGQKSEASSPSSLFHLLSSRALAFPICFFLVAVPWPSGLENLLVQSLMRSNVATTVELLGLFGIPAVQQGNVIEVGTGVVGIDEACSGIRSLQGTLMISLFLGELYRLTILRRVWLIVLGFVLAFTFNVGRTLLLTEIASARGVGAVASWHDPAGVTILVACFLFLWLLALWLKRKTGVPPVSSSVAQASSPAVLASTPAGPTPDSPTRSSKSDVRCSIFDAPPARPSSAFPLRWVSATLGAWLLLVEGGTEFWYRLHERGVRDHAKWSVAWPSSQAVSQVVAISPAIHRQFRYDEGMERRWQDANGADWQLYYFRWFPARSLSKRVAIQLAKTHGPEKCLPAAGMRPKSDLGIMRIPVGDLELALHQYVFEAEGRQLHVFYGIYEDQGGSEALVNRRLTPASRIQAALTGSRNYGQRFLEVAVCSYERPEDAKAALTRELAARIREEP
jgi:exosortase